MDLRIVNTCNNNCLYCLEQEYRSKEKFEEFEIICSKIMQSKNDKIINFYGGNSLLHPKIADIINFSKKSGFESIGLLTNTFGLNEKKFGNLISAGLNNIGFYFNSFDNDKHKLINGNGITLKDLLKNIENISKSGIFYKAIIHINKQNIETLYRDIYILNQKFQVNNFEFVNYFPFDRPYENKDILDYDFLENRIFIDKLFQVIKKQNLSVKFSKFPLDFFGKNIEFYDFDNGILSQIGEEDIIRLKEKIPFCYLEKRCNSCFIKDNCKFYGK